MFKEGMMKNMARGKVYNKIYNEEDWSKVNNENKNIMEDYLDEYRQRKKSLGTIKQYKNDLRISLNGKWNFSYAECPLDIPDDIMWCRGGDQCDWKCFA